MPGVLIHLGSLFSDQNFPPYFWRRNTGEFVEFHVKSLVIGSPLLFYKRLCCIYFSCMYSAAPNWACILSHLVSKRKGRASQYIRLCCPGTTAKLPDNVRSAEDLHFSILAVLVICLMWLLDISDIQCVGAWCG